MPSPGFNQFPAGVPRIEPFPLEACNAINARLYLGKAPNRQPTYPHQTAKSCFLNLQLPRLGECGERAVECLFRLGREAAAWKLLTLQVFLEAVAAYAAIAA